MIKKLIVIKNLAFTFSKSHLIKYFEKDEFIFFKRHTSIQTKMDYRRRAPCSP
jgi:hypothetical protein